MTQAGLASAIGVSFQQVQKYEKGLSAISRDRLLQICNVMNLPLDYFTYPEGGYIGKAAEIEKRRGQGASEAASIAAFVCSGEGQRLIRCFLNISDLKLRTRIADFIASLAED